MSRGSAWGVCLGGWGGVGRDLSETFSVSWHDLLQLYPMNPHQRTSRTLHTRTCCSSSAARYWTLTSGPGWPMPITSQRLHRLIALTLGLMSIIRTTREEAEWIAEPFLRVLYALLVVCVCVISLACLDTVGMCTHLGAIFPPLCKAALMQCEGNVDSRV